MSSRAKPQILVVAHDAGSAEIIAAHVKKHLPTTNFVVYVAGPALRIFRREQIAFHRIPTTVGAIVNIIKKNLHASSALLGTGWMTTIERDALREAKAFGLKTAVYLESWSNYRERFGYPHANWQKNLPDEIWLGDKPALLLAQKFFKHTTLRYVPNQYFVNIKNRYRRLKHGASKSPDVLFLSDAVSGMEKVFEEFLLNLSAKPRPYHIRIRFHPADDRKRYDQIIAHMKDVADIKKSGGKDLVRDLSAVNAVVGTETVAMVGSVLVGKKTISITLLGDKKAKLPFPKIIRVRTARAAARLI